jgi:hypothetical protein
MLAFFNDKILEFFMNRMNFFGGINSFFFLYFEREKQIAPYQNLAIL